MFGLSKDFRFFLKKNIFFALMMHSYFLDISWIKFSVNRKSSISILEY